MAQKHLALLRKKHQEVGAANVNINQVHAEYKRLNLNSRIAAVLTGIYGSMWFVYFLATGAAGWMLWQSVFDAKPFDPYPYLLLLFMGNLIQLLGGPIIQVGQNLSSAHSELRAELDLHVNQESFARLEQILERLDRHQEMLLLLKLQSEMRLKKRKIPLELPATN